MQFHVTIEGRLTTSAMSGATRNGHEYVTFTMIHRSRYRDNNGKWVDGKAMEFDVMCWGELAGRARHLTRGDVVTVECGQLLPYINDDDLPALKVQARNISISMRFTDAQPVKGPRSRRGDLVTTADGEKVTADTYPEVVTDRELQHH
ncbi:single-stranded DNA-binding protein [Dactylosporangium sp. NPDC051485]|uniref:single-stranded DNA-binding protein n=1 Tax=Dactylosporangium sp. NPDC051485 TaxID=3154846 RepID=UPI00342E343C